MLLFSLQKSASENRKLLFPRLWLIGLSVMSSIQLLRVLVNERLAAAADDILEAVKKTIAGYEEEILLSKREIRRQRRMLQRESRSETYAGKHSGL